MYTAVNSCSNLCCLDRWRIPEHASSETESDDIWVKATVSWYGELCLRGGQSAEYNCAHLCFLFNYILYRCAIERNCQWSTHQCCYRETGSHHPRNKEEAAHLPPGQPGFSQVVLLPLPSILSTSSWDFWWIIRYFSCFSPDQLRECVNTAIAEVGIPCSL